MRFIQFLLCTLLFVACKTPQDIVYFEGSNNLEKIKVEENSPIIYEVGDLVSIYVSAVDMETTLPFNLSQGTSEEGVAGTPKYLIGYDGTIEFPVLGKLKIAGLSREKTVELLKDRLSEYINEPTVTVKIENFKITVLGEVNAPGEYLIANGKVNIIQAIGLAGDLTIKGKRQNITVVRENDSLKTYHKIDLTSKNIFNSKAFHLNQNDVVYVEPNKSKIRESITNNNTLAIAISLVGVLFSFLNLTQ